MSATVDTWLSEAFFDEVEQGSLDGGETSQGALWHAVSPRWGHSMHTMCSYHGMFPAKLAHYFIQRFSYPDDCVLDPFSGRGTTILQARVEGRRVVGNDLNPLAYVLTRAKADPPTWKAIMTTVDRLEEQFKARRKSSSSAPTDIEMLYHPHTLDQLIFLRSHLLRRPMSKWSRNDFMIAGAIAGILHGAHRANGSSQYLSISMPNTFSMAPEYVNRYIQDNGLVKIDQDVFECLRDKLGRLYLDDLPGPAGSVTRRDAIEMVGKGRVIADGSVDLFLTSPPYLDVVNYGTSNWIRLWWLGFDEVARDAGAGRRALDALLDHQHSYESYREFMRRTFSATARVLKLSGVAVFVIGDVASPGRDSVPLADKVWEEVGDGTGLRLVEVIEDSLPTKNKVSRIWGDTKGKATERDRVLVLARSDGEPLTDNRVIDWDEPYRDAGPDAAHRRVRRR
jgi:hypothetical protein